MGELSSRREFLRVAAAGLGAVAVGPLLRSQARKSHRPNILFAISDDQSWPHASAYGCRFVHTPNFDRVAREGVLFTHTFAAAPQCSPNRAAILTGRHIWQLEEAGTHNSLFPKKFTVYTEILEDAGYFVGYTGKGWGPGNWKDAGWKRNPAGYEFNRRRVDKRPTKGISSVDYAGNFADFLKAKPKDRPFCFWYGGHEPHRRYEEGSGIRMGKDPADVSVPGFLPDDPLVRSDMLDYAVEIEWFDRHFGKMLKLLEEAGELQNTLIVVTSDNGMPFPRAKANLYEYGIHMPLAIWWPGEISGGKVVDDLVSFVDFAPTFLEAAGERVPEAVTGRSLLGDLGGSQESFRKYVLAGRERHSHSRPDNLGYPSRAIRTERYLYVWNPKPDRWPAGDPTGSGEPEGYHDIDPSPTKTFMIQHRDDPSVRRLFELGFGKRPEEELYEVDGDPYCLRNLAGEPAFQGVRQELQAKLHKLLRQQGDPRELGYGDIFESYPRFGRMRNFPGFKERGKYNPKYRRKH